MAPQLNQDFKKIKKKEEKLVAQERTMNIFSESFYEKRNIHIQSINFYFIIQFFSLGFCNKDIFYGYGYLYRREIPFLYKYFI